LLVREGICPILVWLILDLMVLVVLFPFLVEDHCLNGKFTKSTIFYKKIGAKST